MTENKPNVSPAFRFAMLFSAARLPGRALENLIAYSKTINEAPHADMRNGIASIIRSNVMPRMQGVQEIREAIRQLEPSGPDASTFSSVLEEATKKATYPIDQSIETVHDFLSASTKKGTDQDTCFYALLLGESMLAKSALLESQELKKQAVFVIMKNFSDATDQLKPCDGIRVNILYRYSEMLWSALNRYADAIDICEKELVILEKDSIRLKKMSEAKGAMDTDRKAAKDAKMFVKNLQDRIQTWKDMVARQEEQKRSKGGGDAPVKATVTPEVAV